MTDVSGIRDFLAAALRLVMPSRFLCSAVVAARPLSLPPRCRFPAAVSAAPQARHQESVQRIDSTLVTNIPGNSVHFSTRMETGLATSFGYISGAHVPHPLWTTGCPWR